MFKKITSLLIFASSISLLGCSSVTKVTSSISSITDSITNSVASNIANNIKSKPSDLERIESSFFQSSKEWKGNFYHGEDSGTFTLDLSHITSKMIDADFQKINTKFKGNILLEHENINKTIPISFVVSNMFSEKDNYITGHKFTIESINLEQFHKSMSHSYKKSFYYSLQQLFSTQVDGLVLIDMNQLSKENLDKINHEEKTSNKY